MEQYHNENQHNINEDNAQQIHSQQPHKKQSSGFMKMVLAGVVGSALTLGVTELPNYYQMIIKRFLQLLSIIQSRTKKLQTYHKCLNKFPLQLSA